MPKGILQATMCGVLFAATGSVVAAPFSSFDPRSYGMGGTGVASGTSANAGFFNPSLLATADEDEDFSLEFPIIGGRAADPGDLIDAIDDFDSSNYIDQFDTARQAIDAAITTNDVAALDNARQPMVDATNNLITGLDALNNKALIAELEAGLVVGIPSKKFGASLYVRGWVVGGAQAVISSADLAVLQTISDSLATLTIADSLTGDPILTSAIDVRFAGISEVGLSLAREFNIAGHDIAIGITPKYVSIETYDFRIGDESDPTTISLDEAEIDLDSGQLDDSGVDLDVGIARDFGNGWKAGLVVKNLIGQEFKTVRGNIFELKTQARVGVSHQTEWTTVAFDLDLIENDPVIKDKDTGLGFDKETQYAAIGAEFDMWDVVQFRAGYRHNMSDSDTSIMTAGFGLSPFGVHIDVAVAGNDDELGGSLQLGFRF
ncbi:MAG: conjugal transfer protein TraF [Gammaproteobacteria bacterium]|nr:conjugal transfer protein TraF [Gammaproteobacteria bacterium]